MNPTKPCLRLNLSPPSANIIKLFLLGFSSGLPIALIYSTASVWFNEAGVNISSVTWLSFALLPYSFKFFWAPLVDQLPIRGLQRLGQRRAWLLTSQISILLLIVGLANCNPSMESQRLVFALLAIGLGLASATQDIVIDAYRIEAIPASEQGRVTASYQLGYRIALLLATAGAFYLSDQLGSSKTHYQVTAWQQTYFILAALSGLGLLTTLFMAEPRQSQMRDQTHAQSSQQFLLLFSLLLILVLGVFYLSSPAKAQLQIVLIEWTGNPSLGKTVASAVQLLLALSLAMIVLKGLKRHNKLQTTAFTTAYYHPIREFLNRYPPITVAVLLLIMGFYRVSDQVLGTVANVFYQDLQFSKTTIATAVKTFGLLMTLAGIALGGWLSKRLNTFSLLLWGAILAALSNLLFFGLAKVGAAESLLYGVISIDNLSAGIASVAFVSFLSQLTRIEFTATQYAIFSSLMTFFPRILGGYSGGFIEHHGYSSFFVLTTLLGIPVIILILWAKNRMLLSTDAA